MAMDAMLGSTAFGLAQGLQQDRRRGLASLTRMQNNLASAQQQQMDSYNSTTFSNCIVTTGPLNAGPGEWVSAKGLKGKPPQKLIEELQADVDEWLPKL